MADESVEWDLRGLALLAKLERDGVDAGRLSLTRECLSAYADVGVMREGRAVRLDCECPCSDECWAGLGANERPDDQHAGVSAPFIGPDYEQYRIVLVAINMHDYGGLGANWWVCGGHIDERLAKGKKTTFEYGVGACAAALRDARDGRQGGDDLPTAEHAADGWRRGFHRVREVLAISEGQQTE